MLLSSSHSQHLGMKLRILSAHIEIAARLRIRRDSQRFKRRLSAQLYDLDPGMYGVALSNVLLTCVACAEFICIPCAN
ncbi:hypothetical protein CBOM_07431 [Ceraceosorus bombacis]|uniref:Uncharacterized protein n=1 Tax=Ceraceosorus bombacis TaxID=401625 RepID=A0A0P1BBS5_9BASI|nr:hypothetical protein CBOM_07431 [Ceraceosorus bombacis]